MDHGGTSALHLAAAPVIAEKGALWAQGWALVQVSCCVAEELLPCGQPMDKSYATKLIDART